MFLLYFWTNKFSFVEQKRHLSETAHVHVMLRKCQPQQNKGENKFLRWYHKGTYLSLKYTFNVQSTVTCWESQSSSAGTAVHLGSGSQPNASHEYRCQLQPDSPVSFLNATCQHFQQCLHRESHLIDRGEDSSTANSLHKSLISFVRQWKWYIIPHSCLLTRESVVSSPRVSAKVWPIQLLCKDGLQCSQYSGSEKSNYGHCVHDACLSRSLHHLSVVNYLWSGREQWGCWESWKTRGKMPREDPIY